MYSCLRAIAWHSELSLFLFQTTFRKHFLKPNGVRKIIFCVSFLYVAKDKCRKQHAVVCTHADQANDRSYVLLWLIIRCRMQY